MCTSPPSPLPAHPDALRVGLLISPVPKCLPIYPSFYASPSPGVFTSPLPYFCQFVQRFSPSSLRQFHRGSACALTESPTPMHDPLDGYSHLQWPDLSATRSPLDGACVASAKVSLPALDSSVNVPHLVLAAIARVVGAYCGVTDLLFALPVDEAFNVGLVRVSWTDEDSWSQILAVVGTGIAHALAHATTLAAVKKSLSLAEHQPPCIALVVLDQDASHSQIEYPVIFSYSSAKSLLQLSAAMDIVHPSISDQIVAQTSEIIYHAVTKPASKVSLIPSLQSSLMSACERGTDDEVASFYSRVTKVDFAPDYLDLRASDSPSRTAVRWYPNLSLEDEEQEFEALSYLEFDRKANQVAHWLLRQGLQPEDRIAVCLDRNLKYHTAVFGIMRAGGCYVPIDPDLPLERKVYIAKDANARYVFTSSQISSDDVFGAATCYFDDDLVQQQISHESTDSVNCMKPTALAYLLYTSGTTGNPKGCLLTHQGLAEAILALSNAAADVRMDDIRKGRYLAVASIAFDVHLAETIVPVALGMPLLSARRSQLFENLPAYVNLLGITHLGIVPSLIEATLNAATNGSDIALRYIASGGEKMSDAILDKWANHPQVRLANFYGPSEVTIGCCARPMSSTTPRANIGRAFANVSSYVVDSNMKIVMRGGVGELVVEGPLVGRGYHGRDDLTAKAFVEWPEKGRWAYRTGDLVRMMPDSTLEILGRIDTQIKLRGVRIESEGISAIVRNAVPSSAGYTLDVTTILSKHPGINVDQLVSIISWDKSISIATRKSQKPRLISPPVGLLKAIKAKCEAELPVYMRPSHVLPLGWLPLSSNGKTDEKVLAQLFKDLDVQILANISSEESSVDSRQYTDREIAVFDALQKCLSIPLDRPHPDLNVFECGLDSMSAIRFATVLKETLNMDISASVIMKKPRISDIASYKVTTTREAPSGQSPSVNRLDLIQDDDLPFDIAHVETVHPSFTVQEGVLGRSAEEDSLYVQHVLISCHASTSVLQLQQAWKNLVKRQQILRTVFHFGRTLSQVVLRPDQCNLQWTAEEIPPIDQDAFKHHFLTRRAQDIAKDINRHITSIPPYRVSSFTTADHTFLAISIHHSLFDGVSLPCLMLEVEREYLCRKPQPVASAEEILSHIGKIDRDQARAFWTSYFEGFRWPQQSSGPRHSGSHRQSVSFTSPLSAVKLLASSQRITLQALLTGAFALHAARDLYKSTDVAFGVLRSGRLLPVDFIESAIFPLVSVVPTRVHFDGTRNILQSMQEGISSMVEYEHLPLGNVQSWVRPGYPLFDALFSMSVASVSSGEIWTVIESEPPRPDYVLAVEVVINHTEDTIRVQAAWKDDGLSDIVIGMLYELETTVRELGVDPETCISRHLTGLGSSSGVEIVKDATTEVPAAKDLDIVDPVVLDGLRSIISDFLQVDATILTPSMSFVSLGLDSIKSVGLAKLLSKNGFPVTSTELLQNSSLISTANCVALKLRTNQDETQDQHQPIIRVDDNAVSEIKNQRKIELTADDAVSFHPTTALQTGMLSQTINSGGRLYVHAFPMVIEGELDTDRLFKAWKTAVRCFPILRTTFHFAEDSGVWFQALHTAEVLDWAEIPLQTNKEYASALKTFFSAIVLDDENSFVTPPLWVRLFKPAAGDATLVFAMHHALYDGISVGLLTKAIENIYERTFRPESVQFFDVLPLILTQEHDGTTFWTNKLRTFQPATLIPRHDPRDHTSITVERELLLDKKDVSDVLRQASATMQCICQAAWSQVLAKYTGASDVIFGHTVAGRSIPGAEFVVGPTLNTIPCCIRVLGGNKRIDLLKSIHQGNLEALPWQHASARAIQKSLGVTSLWDSLFLFQSSVGTVDDTTSMWKFDEISSNQGVHIQYPLNVELLHTDSGVRFKCAVQPTFLNQDELDVLADDLTSYINHIIQDPFGVIGVLQSHKPQSNAPQGQGAFNSQADTVDNAENLLSLCGGILAPLVNVPISAIKAETPLATLGIDSITAIQIASKFKKSGLNITTNDILNSQTIGEMLEKTSSLTVTSQASASHNPIVGSSQKVIASGHVTPSPLGCTITDKEKLMIYEGLDIPARAIESISIPSPGMKWLIGAWQRSHKTRFQHVFPFQLSFDIPSAQLRAAWFSLVQRHAILRSTISCVPGQQEPRLITFKIPDEDSWTEEGVPSHTFYASLMVRMKTMVANPPALNRPQARALFFSSNCHSYLVFHFHHFQYDAWSLKSLLYDFSQICTNKTSSISCDLSAFLQHCIPDNDTLEEQRRYWQNSFPPNFKPTLFPALNPNAGSTRRVERLIRTRTSCISNASRLEERACERGVSLQSVFLAVWSKIQADITGSSSSTFGLWQSGRTDTLVNIAELAVPCMNVLPLHVGNLLTREPIAVAQNIQTDLYKRSSAVGQSDLVRVGSWVGAVGKPLCNVFVNVVKVGSEVKDDNLALKFAHAPYFVPDKVNLRDESTYQFEITKLIQDDLFVDIASINQSDSIMMSIDAGAHLLKEAQADALISRWASEVEKVLGMSE